MKVLIASDHAGFDLKQALIDYLADIGHFAEDLGPTSADRVDYPDFAHPLAKRIDAGEEAMGILVCGSGNGVCMTANKYANVRAALVWTEDLARLARAHNNANVLCLPARFIDEAEAKAAVNAFLSSPFEGGRHSDRVDKISC